ncbi:hypothetical protein CAC42_5143 [Sphaceloma murrayae]|uniref:Uncharacterized protein n=1 Tax=Sphaceloma murrayae TaxID=2082308 RepID=A0A2K1QU55_9PEZI|nr:hypothetical protein CAC42_5143 [Sphaceloma murrayae]
MTTLNQDNTGHSHSAHGRRSHSPHLPPIQDAHSQQSSVTDAWTSAFARLQDQVHYNTTAIDDQRRHLADLHEAMRAMHADIGSMWRHVDACREEVQQRSGIVRPEHQDIDILTQHLQSVDRKASEVEVLKVQLDIMTQRLRRLEEAQPVPHPPIAAPAHHYPQQQPHGTPASEHRSIHHAQTSESRPTPTASTLQQTSDARPASEFAAGPEARTVPGFRALESSTGVTSWRAASAHATGPTGTVPRDPAPASQHEPTHSSGWATVNAAGHGKRPASIDAGAPSHDSSAPASPKRQKLATLMPRSSIGDHTASHAAYPHPEALVTPSHRTASGESQAQHPANVPTNTMRFIAFPPNVEAAVQQQEAWRNEQAAAEQVRGRGRGGRSRGRGRKSGSEGAPDDTDMSDRPEWSESQSDGYYRHSHHSYAISPQEGVRGRELQPAGYAPESYHSSAGQESTSPANLQESGKKSRTKPTRNANGILIRKDGRPDMRSISSAQNLRKVHAKKEAERNGEINIHDPTSATSSNQTHASDDRSSIVDGSNTESPITPTAESRDRAEHRIHRGFASINDDRTEQTFKRREGSDVPETQLQAPPDQEPQRSASRVSHKDEHVKREPDTHMTDSVMMDRTEAQFRETQEKSTEMPPRVEPTTITA